MANDGEFTPVQSCGSSFHSSSSRFTISSHLQEPFLAGMTTSLAGFNDNSDPLKPGNRFDMQSQRSLLLRYLAASWNATSNFPKTNKPILGASHRCQIREGKTFNHWIAYTHQFESSGCIPSKVWIWCWAEFIYLGRKAVILWSYVPSMTLRMSIR